MINIISQQEDYIVLMIYILIFSKSRLIGLKDGMILIQVEIKMDLSGIQIALWDILLLEAWPPSSRIVNQN